jgi:hypothetical protein
VAAGILNVFRTVSKTLGPDDQRES